MDTLDEILKQYRYRSPVEMRWNDLDEVGHVNNAIYLTYFEQARVFYFHESCQWNWKDDGVIVASNLVNYISPLFFPSPAYIYVRTTRLGTKSFDVEYQLVNEYPDRKELIVTGKTVLVMFDYKTQKPFPIPDHLRAKLIAYETTPIIFS